MSSRDSRSKRTLFLAGALLAVASAPAFAIKPFSADYQASYKGIQGAGKMTLEPQGGDKWKYTLVIGSSGLQLKQATVFEENGGNWRPLTSDDASMLLIKQSQQQATYDWKAKTATWTGDVKPERAGPVALQVGDVDGLLLNLVIARDALAGKPLTYRLVDDGRAKALNYKVVGKENVTIGGQSKSATKLTQSDGNKEISAWVVEGLPVPARILQRKDGRDEIDLKIQAIH